jgi:enterochelin esterase family protein
VSEKLVHTSRIYDGMKSDYWIYVPAHYTAATPAALMVWQDGEVYVDRNASRTQNVIDNLIHQKKIPVMIQVFISPGLKGTQRMRSNEYDTVDDTYARFLRDEIIAEVQAKYSIRRDGYSRGIAGESSGAICAFNVAWHQPDQFSRVLSRIGSYTSIQWWPGVIDGGNVYPFKVRKEPKRNIRVWLEDGSEDLENNHGSWPLQNIQMANSLKMRGYDFRFSWGNAQHNRNNGHAQLPEALTWLWRGYDPAKTTAEYEQEPAEKGKPMFRVRIYNR